MGRCRISEEGATVVTPCKTSVTLSAHFSCHFQQEMKRCLGTYLLWQIWVLLWIAISGPKATTGDPWDLWGYRCPSPGSQSTPPPSSSPAFLLVKTLRHLKSFFCSCLLARQSPAQPSWTSQQLILIHLLKLCVALLTCLQRVTWQSTCNTRSGLSSTQSTAAAFAVIQSKCLQSPPELQGVQAFISYLQREQEP